MRRFTATSVAGVLSLITVVACSHENPPPSGAPAGEAGSAAVAKVELDLDRAVAVALPEASSPLEPVAFRTSDGREGWILKLPTPRPLATPAIDDGLVFIGGGYGSYEFYAFDATTGAMRWTLKTSDDGPTAAVVEDGLVAFNTESCTVIVAEAKTGKIVWQEWLGDPLMSQPAIWNGRLYMAHPAGQRREAGTGSPGDFVSATANAGTAAPSRYGHRLLCAELRTGKHLWDRPITGDVITAPVIANGQVHFTCFDGTAFCVDAVTGDVAFEKPGAATSAPLVVNNRLVVTRKELRAGESFEGIEIAQTGSALHPTSGMFFNEKAEYLASRPASPLDDVGGATFQFSQLDASVGFATPPAAAKLGDAQQLCGVSTVAGGWAYQGSKAVAANGLVMNAQGRHVNCMAADGSRVQWRAECNATGIPESAQVFAPPSLGRRNLYLCSTAGHLASLAQADGTLEFLYAFNRAVWAQPALSGGNVYVATADGHLVCLKTGGRDADGWHAWGGNAQHNKAE